MQHVRHKHKSISVNFQLLVIVSELRGIVKKVNNFHCVKSAKSGVCSILHLPCIELRICHDAGSTLCCDSFVKEPLRRSTKHDAILALHLSLRVEKVYRVNSSVTRFSAQQLNSFFAPLDIGPPFLRPAHLPSTSFAAVEPSL